MATEDMKKVYVAPVLEVVEIDAEISMIMMSPEPKGSEVGDEESVCADCFRDDPYKVV